MTTAVNTSYSDIVLDELVNLILTTTYNMGNIIMSFFF